MELVKATMKEAKGITVLVKKVIETVYPKYYNQEAVDAFLDLHKERNIGGDIILGKVWLLYDKGILVGTGTCDKEHITRVYILPECQGKGYGTYLMDYLEKKVMESYNSISLDTSLPARNFYFKRGYKTIRECEWQVKGKVVTTYEIMEKVVNQIEEKMKLQCIMQPFSICKIPDTTHINWEDPYYFIGKTDEELSLVCSTQYVPESATACEHGFRGFRIQGILDFSLIGILAKIAGTLAEHSIGIFVVSTFNTDYILVKEEQLGEAKKVLEAKDYVFEDEVV